METVKNAVGGKKEKWGKKNRKVKSKKVGKTKMGKKWKIYHKKKRLLNAH